jgi:hypothetical protein
VQRQPLASGADYAAARCDAAARSNGSSSAGEGSVRFKADGMGQQLSAAGHTQRFHSAVGPRCRRGQGADSV